MAALEFSFSEVAEEVNAINRLTQPFIHPEFQFVLPQIIENLNSIREQEAGRSSDWQIRPEKPLTTITSYGDYEPSGKGEHNVFAELSFVWTVSPLGNHGSRYYNARRFALTDKASTRICLFEKHSEGKRSLGSWRMEIADDRGPGSHFHTQVLGESVELPFPHSLSIPRLPSLMFTPMLVLEYVLAELFQQRWSEHVGVESSELGAWRRIQKKRLRKFFSWQERELQTALGSPWMAMKRLKPPADLFDD